MDIESTIDILLFLQCFKVFKQVFRCMFMCVCVYNGFVLIPFVVVLRSNPGPGTCWVCTLSLRFTTSPIMFSFKRLLLFCVTSC